jgi:hypothetical protein
MTAAGAQQLLYPQQQLLYPQQQQQLYMLILVLSAPDHFEQRQLMRSIDWRTPPGRGGAARIVFLLGHVDSEGERTAAFALLLLFLCPAALHTVANISMRIFPISLIFLVSGILFF